MPYIKQEQRDILDPAIDALIEKMNSLKPEITASMNSRDAAYLELAGILNYCCTRLGLEVIPVRKYWAIALKSGVFRNIADELYRRYAAPYEEEAISRNGDIAEFSK